MFPSAGQSQDKQKTIVKDFCLSGVGVHSGKESFLLFSPAPPNFGICFVKEGRLIPALVEQVAGGQRGTTLEGIAVIEHLLSALYALGIDNLQIEIKGEEVPVLDGSALPYLESFEAAGILEQSLPRNFMVLNRPLKIFEEEASLEALPRHGFKVDFMVDYPAVGEQCFVFDLWQGDYKKEIAPARTFGYIEEYEILKEQGLALGATLENALVLSKDGYLNNPRFPDEPVRHKILDLIGDLALLGRPLQAEIKAVKSSHKLNIMLVRRLLEDARTRY